MKYQVEVDRTKCIRCSACYGLDPEHFEGDAENTSQVVGGTTNGKSVGTFNDDRMAKAKEAADACPVGAITVTEQK